MSKAKILIVEDEAILAKDIQNILKVLGYTVSGIVSTGKDAIQKASEGRPDLVLMDIKLKGNMDGVEAAKQIKDRYDIPVIYLTAHADDNTLQRAKMTGPYGYILKPFEERDLSIGIEMSLYKHEIERKLKESEQWLATTLKCMSDGMIATDTMGKVTFMNPVAEELTGWKQKDALGKDVTKIFNLINEQTRAQAESPVNMVMHVGNTTRPEDYLILIAADGKEKCVDYSTSLIRNDDDSNLGVVLVFRDITERKQMEKRLLQSEKLSALGKVTSGVAHEFNNILAIISGNAQLLEGGYADQDELTEKLYTIRKATTNGAEIVRRMREFTRVENEDVSRANLTKIDINKLIKDTIDLSKGKDKTKGLKYQINLKDLGNVPSIMGKHSELGEVLINIINNALDAMPEGGRLSFSSWAKDDTVFASISDTGKGMSEEIQKKLFDPFFTTRAPMRSGLGMSVAHGIMKRHGGAIEVESKEGDGSAITLSFPMSKV